MTKYTWKPPLISEGDQYITYYDHRDNTCVGECMRVVTHYSKGKAYHIYEMRKYGHHRRTAIGEERLVIKEQP